MGDTREYSEPSEDKTEAFSQTEIQARLHRSRMEELNAMNSTVPLDNLVVPPDEDIRILMRPLARDRRVHEQHNLVPIALRTEVTEEDGSSHRVLAVRQTSRDVNFTVTIPDYLNPNRRLTCVFYYHPGSDSQILVNRSNMPVTLFRPSPGSEVDHGEQYEINPDVPKTLAPGTWRINMDGTDLLDFRLLERRPPRLRGGSSSSLSDLSGMGDLVNASGKRFIAEDADDAASPEKRRRPSDDKQEEEDRVIVILPAKVPAKGEKGRDLAASNGHPLLDLQPDETLEVPRGAELVGYTITKKEQIASTALSSVFTAEYSEAPGRYVVVKVLRTSSPTPSADKKDAVARNVIRQAQTWLRELENQEKLQHKSIVRLYGGDARFLSLYMEPVDGRDLATKGTWRTAGTDLFAGDRSDALHILQDIASALHYLHGKGLVHNDIKPNNILYSRERGAVLCDLGLSSERGEVSGGGTPWYVAPEFIGLRQRGAPSDVWALGVVMLYVMGKISWPDVRAHKAHPRHLHWIIRDVNAMDARLQSAAVSSMRRWLGEVTAVRNGLDVHDKLERLVHGMLAPNPRERLTTKDIITQLFSEQAAEA